MTELFQNISPKNKEKLLKSFEANTLYFKKGDSISKFIYEEDTIGIIEYGQVQIIRNDYNGNQIIVESLGKNDLIGSLIFHISSSEYSVVAKEDAKIIIIEYYQIINCEENKANYYNEFIKNFLNILTYKINEKNERIEILTKKTIRNKLLEYFRIASQKSGSKIIYLPFSYTELADYLAIDRSAMSREIKNLKDEGFIRTSNKKITILY